MGRADKTGDSERVEEALRELRDRTKVISSAHATVDSEEELFPSESAYVASFTPMRRSQFCAGRKAARSALAALAIPRAAIPSTDRGVPVFPVGYCGSISHKHAHAIAVAAPTSAVGAIGIDLEIDREPEETDLLQQVCTKGEVREIGTLSDAGLQSPATWFLSAKEAAFKAVFPLDGIERDFHEIEVAFSPDGTYSVRRMLAADSVQIVGSYAFRGPWLICLAIVRGYAPFDFLTSLP